MSDSEAIETGARRKVQSLSRPRTQSIGKRRKIDKAKDELELGRFTGKPQGRAVDEPTKGRRPAESGGKDELELGRFTGGTGEKAGNEAPIKRGSGQQSRVVGPKRKKVDSDDVKAERRRSGGELEIASTRKITDDEPARPKAKRRRRTMLAGTSAGTDASWVRFAVLGGLSGLLVLLTAIVFFLMPRYDVVGAPLLADPAFGSELDGWRQAGSIVTDPDDASRILLESVDPADRTFLYKDLALPSGDLMLELRASVRSEGVAPGPEIWDRARIYLAQLDPQGQPRWEEDHVLFDIDGTTEVRNYRRTFAMPAEVTVARLGIELKNATGRLSVADIQLTPVQRTTLFLLAVGALLHGWAALTLYVGVKTFAGIESVRIKIALGVACVLAVIALMLPGDIHDFSTASIAARFGIDGVDVDLVGHGVMFALLAFLVRLGRPSDPLWLHAGTWVLIAIASEVLQLFTVGRDPSFEDLMLDAIGILAGLTLAQMVGLVRRSTAA